MILAAGLTPAWQQIMRFTSLRPGEVNRAAEVHWCASGKVLNVGLALAALDARSHTLSPCGGWSGHAIQEEFKRRDLPATWTPCEAPTRVCTTVLNDNDQSTTELVENAAAMTEAERQSFIAAYAGLVDHAQVVVLTGSLPTGTPGSFYRELLERTRCPALLDVRGPELLVALPARPFVVKPNREELALTLGQPLGDLRSLLSAMRELLKRGACNVIVTQGKEPVYFMDAANVWELDPPEVEPVINPIGCGDCLAGAVAWSLARGDALPDAVRFGIAAAAENLTHILPASLTMARVMARQESIPLPKRILET